MNRDSLIKLMAVRMVRAGIPLTESELFHAAVRNHGLPPIADSELAGILPAWATCALAAAYEESGVPRV